MSKNICTLTSVRLGQVELGQDNPRHDLVLDLGHKIMTCPDPTWLQLGQLRI